MIYRKTVHTVMPIGLCYFHVVIIGKSTIAIFSYLYAMQRLGINVLSNLPSTDVPKTALLKGKLTTAFITYQFNEFIITHSS